MHLKLIILFTFFLATTLYAIEPGQKIPEFSLRDYNGTIHYSADICGAKAKDTKLLILDFFATWCEPCKKILPIYKKLEEKFKGKGLKIFLISYQDREKSIKEFAKANDVPFPILMDKYGGASQGFGVFGLPRTFIIGSDCTLKKQIIGEQKNLEEILIKEIEGVIGGGK